MPSFPKPNFDYVFDTNTEINKLRTLKTNLEPGIPNKTNGKLLIATWNIANLGDQEREPRHYQLIAEIISWFDIVAIQEVKDNLSGLNGIRAFLPNTYKSIFSDAGGNNERSVFLYNETKLRLLEKVGEVNVSPKDYPKIKIGDLTGFTGFDRNPYFASFDSEGFRFLAISVHSFFGSEQQIDLNRRILETFAIARWADLRRDSVNAYLKNILVMGDFNLPKIDNDDSIYKALIAKGLQLPDHSTRVYSAISGDKQYDQIAFFPSLKNKILKHGVFSFDNTIFSNLWADSPSKFRAYLRYYISDHRPMWIELDLT
jgi:endonuclease/exonuclease/phosphatase family metal-dependent hydrolase